MYHGKNISVVYDKTGSHYRHGKGLILLVNGKKVAQRDTLGKLEYKL